MISLPAYIELPLVSRIFRAMTAHDPPVQVA